LRKLTRSFTGGRGESPGRESEHAVAHLDPGHAALGADHFGHVGKKDAGPEPDVDNASAFLECEALQRLAALSDDVGGVVDGLQFPRRGLVEQGTRRHGWLSAMDGSFSGAGLGPS
jgi:hypothetical protein